MTTLGKSIERISEYLWKPVTITTDEQTKDAFFFDVRELSQEAYIAFLEDTLVLQDFLEDFGDTLDPETMIFFGAAGVINYADDLDTNHTLSSMTQIDVAYTIDTANGTDEAVPVYQVEVDGTVIPGTLTKIADDVSQLNINLK